MVWPELYQETVSNNPLVVQDTTIIRSYSTGSSRSNLITSHNQQDSIPAKASIPNSGVHKTDSLFSANNSYIRKNLNKVLINDSSQIAINAFDSTSLCKRNVIADITYSNPDYVIRSIELNPVNRFPYLFTERTVKFYSDTKSSIEYHLRTGQTLPQKLLHADWVIGVILFSTILFTVVRATTKSFIPGIARFFLFRGTKDEGSRDLLGIFQWQSTLLNFSSFSLIGLFACFAALYYDIVPFGISDYFVWLVSLGTIIAALTLRHLVCVGTGICTGQYEVFQDYLHTIYQSYRFGALFSFILVVLIAYTHFLPDKSYFITGAILLILLYLIRISRLFILFINRNISIFYLILYLCALEILPVLISLKYFSGLA